ncbi:glycoside hydrolase family 99-like domain-containing protein [Paenibacillus sp. MBLB2552]|uniref:Glycoside hydrolase family 99-like domain-containing protein n=1 Tax=Paenibacillus mellifer TaxID=2937794 RepID=A0A9X1XZY8_9BACL|nr:glycoside hydrolase family 99-like domain-containing protein [Paenibacillus mellifer]MCK8489040.1 glycoside hydrolase family 99-like domain-containing protein [Paenibacillus mellifer]
MKTIAFYLPQYHPIQQNNEWWGKGFTEWTNVSKARPLYSGHYQPHIPADLGFYDLRLPETRTAQAELAKTYGIDAFCYYHYWFNGRMLLERPFNEVLSSGEPDLPFCLCWANENWTRRWDGRELNVLMEQDYQSYDPKEHIKWLAQAFLDDRYLKIDGKPLFLIYKASEIPNLKDLICTWRREIREFGLEDIHLCCADNSQHMTRKEYFNLGFDSVYEFTPNFSDLPKGVANSSVPGLNVYDYKKIVQRELEKEINENELVFPCVFPSWDNTARRKNNATVIQNEDPNVYGNWLKHCINRVSKYKPSEQIVFINAWNEWGEGCHLEPDLENGHVFLEVTRQVLQNEFDETQLIENDKLKLIESDLLWDDEPPLIYFNIQRPVYLWGAGSYGIKILQMLSGSSIKIKGFVDSQAKNHTKLVESLPVISPNELINRRQLGENPFILITSSYYEQIAPILNDFGFTFNEDYSLALPNMIINYDYIGGSANVVLEQGLRQVCNVCGYDQFIPEGDNKVSYTCANCNSTSNERMIVELLAEEIGISSKPLAEWVPRKNQKITCLYPVSPRLKTILELNFQMQYITEENISNYLDFSMRSHFIIHSVKSPIHHKFVEEIYRHMRNKGKLLLLLDQLVDQIELKKETKQLLESHKFKVYTVQRDYKRYKTGEQLVLIGEKLIDIF